MHQYAREAEVSKKLQISVQTLRNWRFQKVGPPYHKIRRAVLYDVREVGDWVEKQRIETDG